MGEERQKRGESRQKRGEERQKRGGERRQKKGRGKTTEKNRRFKRTPIEADIGTADLGNLGI